MTEIIEIVTTRQDYLWFWITLMITSLIALVVMLLTYLYEWEFGGRIAIGFAVLAAIGAVVLSTLSGTSSDWSAKQPLAQELDRAGEYSLVVYDDASDKDGPVVAVQDLSTKLVHRCEEDVEVVQRDWTSMTERRSLLCSPVGEAQ